MDLAGGFRAAHRNKIKRVNGDGVGLSSRALLIIKLPDFKTLRLVSRSLFLTLAILALPSIGFIVSSGLSNTYSDLPAYGESISFQSLRLIFRDLADQGLLRRGDSALVVSTGIGDLISDLQSLNDDNPINVVLDSDLHGQNSIPDEAFDFTFMSSFEMTKFADRVTKIGGIIAVQLSNKGSNAFPELPNYKIVHLRRFNSTTVAAMRKTSGSKELLSSSTRRRLCGFVPLSEANAIGGLEDALLEPPRRVLAKWNNPLKETKFLPYLLGKSLRSYRDRVFINVGSSEGKDGGIEWFTTSYPKGNQDFRVYNLKRVTGEDSGESEPPMWILDWLRENVREDEFIVMKAEVEVVEELVKGRTICLVDELFLECETQWENGGGSRRGRRKRRAYWECLALFGKLRDEGVAVHQWWGWA